MRSGRVTVAGMLILLFLGFSFNAYACLVPLYGTAGSAMGHGCSTPDEQSARRFCDAFKTLSVQSAAELPPPHEIDGQPIGSEDTALWSVRVSRTAHSRRVCEPPADGPPQDLFLKTSVLRL